MTSRRRPRTTEDYLFEFCAIQEARVVVDMYRRRSTRRGSLAVPDHYRRLSLGAEYFRNRRASLKRVKVRHNVWINYQLLPVTVLISDYIGKEGYQNPSE